MSSKLPVNIDDLLRQRKVEGDRIEYKAGWNPDPILRTLCAFANDFENLGGGSVVIGQDCDGDGQPIFPPKGVPSNQLDKIQRELIGYCNQIQPPYFPILSIEGYEGRTLVVLWAPGGQNRPYRVPKEVTSNQKELHYYIRRYSNTVEASGNALRELMDLTATVPFDDRMNHHADLDDLRLSLIRSFLKENRSGLYAPSARMPLADLGRNLNIVDGGDEYLKPRNVGLMFFHEAPESFFPGTQIEVVRFPEGVAGGNLEEKTFRGPLHHQLRDAFAYLKNRVIEERVVRLADRAEANRFVNYPFPSLEEALVNAVYHRSYEQREPIEVRVHPDRIEIVSYPGPDPSIRIEALRSWRIVARRYRNRRIGDILKELDLTEGRCTGIPTMQEAMRRNGSPPPRFETDEPRTYFFVELAIHPAFHPDHGPRMAHEGVQAGVQDFSGTEWRILRALEAGPMTTAELTDLLGYRARSRNLRNSLSRLEDRGLIALTIPERPRSPNQRRQLTAKGREAVRGG